MNAYTKECKKLARRLLNNDAWEETMRGYNKTVRVFAKAHGLDIEETSELVWEALIMMPITHDEAVQICRDLYTRDAWEFDHALCRDYWEVTPRDDLQRVYRVSDFCDVLANRLFGLIRAAYEVMAIW